jgi:hypothetical protein
VEHLEGTIEHAVVERRLDVKDIERLLDEAPHPLDAGRERALRRVHVRPALAHHVRVVMSAKAIVPAKADRDGFVPSVHRNEIHVHVDEKVGLDRSPIELDDLAVIGRADELHPFGVFRVVVVEAVGPVGAIDAVADGVTNLLARHPPMNRRRNDDLDVLHAVVGQKVEHDREDALAHVRPAHGGQGQRDVVDGDDHLHPRA